MTIKMLKVILVLVVFMVLGCSQDTASASSDEQIQSTIASSENTTRTEIENFIADLNVNWSDMSSLDKGSYIKAAAIHGEDGQFVLTIKGTLLTDGDGSDESEEWSVFSNDLILGLITIEASKSNLFSGMKWEMNVNKYRIEGARTFPHDPGNDYQKVVIVQGEEKVSGMLCRKPYRSADL